ncbi:ankyrin repeat domain-containing protein [Verrucomicrobiaceae bacterium N1E253]|uniref:Ankyrin repeat domain-containing protein n=1 Tax=Oceaniferula marina TaxID=2748318 RepID=A0A851GMF1_9BACT|nr:ankyrin repeat domain-containing protein [Oceaniferula marina]NWK55990.1 ankyrin repeat domain-containing protein [Oceaniferula marina]
MNKIKTIIIDGIILFAASTAFVLLADLIFSQLKDKEVKDNPLVTSINQGKLDELKKQIESKEYDLAQVDGIGRTSLIRAAYVNFNSLEKTKDTDKERAPMIPLLVSHGAPVDHVDEDDWSALMWASWSGLPLVTEALLKANADISLTGGQGNTALTLAASRGNDDVIELLLKAGADKSVENKSGKTALDLAEEGQAKGGNRQSRYLRTIELLND